MLKWLPLVLAAAVVVPCAAQADVEWKLYQKDGRSYLEPATWGVKGLKAKVAAFLKACK